VAKTQIGSVLMSILLSVGMLGSLVFVIDYLRTINFADMYARVILTLNVGIAGVLFISILRRYHLVHDDFSFVTMIVLFVWIDYALWYQWYLLRKLRKEGRKDG
jgi:hypothetical protein